MTAKRRINSSRSPREIRPAEERISVRTVSPAPVRGPGATGLLLGLFLAILVILPGGCLPPQAEFSLGVGTSRIQGFVNAPAAAPGDGGPIIVSIQYHRTLLAEPDYGGEVILHPTVHVTYVGRGGLYSIPIPGDVVSAEVLFIAPGHLTQVFRFRRSLGLGVIKYRADLRPMPDWRDHYYTYLLPRLQHMILEKRYRLSDSHQQHLSEWLEVQDRRLIRRPGREPPPDEDQPRRDETPAVPRPALPPGSGGRSDQ